MTHATRQDKSQVDSLLAAEDSSDEEATPDRKEAAADAQHGQPPRAELSLAQAMAQGDLSDGDEETTPQSTLAPMRHASPDQEANGEEVPGPSAAVGLDELLAMGDSSDEEQPRRPAPARSSQSPAPKAAGEEAMATGSRGARSAATPRTAVPEEVADDSSRESIEAFLQSPVDWCLEHERSLLRAAEDAAGVTALVDARSEQGGAERALGMQPMAEVGSCPELRRVLAQEYGLPTCVVSHSKHVGVGTLRGAVVLLDPRAMDTPAQPQVLQPPVGGEEVTAVTAAAFSPDGSSVLVGHKSGLLVLWDLATMKVANVVKELHSSPVLSVAFCRPSRQYALSADAKGAVFFLTFTTSLVGRPDCTRQLLMEQSANIGVTLRILPLPPPGPHQVPHTVDQHCLVALCATNATVLLTLHPSVQMLQKMQYNSKEATASSTPDICWLRSEEARDDGAGAKEVSDVLLCIAFGQTLHVMRVSFEWQKSTAKEEFAIRLEQRHSWGSPLQSIVPLNDSMLAILDATSKLSLVQLLPRAPDGKAVGPEPTPEQRTLQVIHAEEVSSWSVVYHSFTGPEGSKDARSHHGALAAFRGRGRTLYICGMREVWRVQVARWGQHIEELIGRGSWSVALDVFLALHKGGLPPLLDFPAAAAARQRAVGQCATQAIQSYLVSRLKQDTARVQARQMCLTAVHACIEMKLWSVLYKTVFECFKAVGLMQIYCGTLEPFIVQGRIPRGHMDSEVLSSILQSYAVPLEEEERGAHRALRDRPGGPPPFVDCDHCGSLFPVARRLQQLVFYVDIAQIDLNCAIRLFTQHRLWTALVHIYCALRDYTSPLELLVGECTQLVRQGLSKTVEQEGGGDAATRRDRDEEAPLLQCRLVRKLFFFLRRAFELRPFPLDVRDGTGMASPPPTAVLELLRSIFKKDLATAGTAESRPRAPPTFYRLLRLSPMMFFDVLSLLFTSPAASHTIQSHGAAQAAAAVAKAAAVAAAAAASAAAGATAEAAAVAPANANSAADGEAPVLGSGRDGSVIALSLGGLFEAVEAALEASLAQAKEEGQPLPSHTHAEFLWFVARAAPKAHEMLSKARLAEVLEHLLAPSEAAVGPRRRSGRGDEEAQQLLVGVLAAQDLSKEHRDACVAKAMQRGFYEVASWVHEENGEFDRALDCRMRDDQLREGIFEYIISRLAAGDAKRSAALVEATLQRLPGLLAVDAERCAAMVCEQVASIADHDRVLQRLEGQQQIELQYLETLLVRRHRSHWKSQEEQQAFFDGHVVRYIELLCSLTPAAVLPFLRQNEALPLRECLELCRRHTVVDGSVYLLERTGDFEAVMELLLGDYGKSLEQLQAALADEGSRTAVSSALKRLAATSKEARPSEPAGAPAASGPPWWEGVASIERSVELLEQVHELCTRNSNLMTASQLEELWFGVLRRTIRQQEAVSAVKGTSKRHACHAAALTELSSRTMAGVLAYLSLPRALERIASEFGSSALSIWQQPLQSMLSGLSFQQGLLEAANAVVAQDIIRPFMSIKRRGSRGVRVSPRSCVPVAPGQVRVL